MYHDYYICICFIRCYLVFDLPIVIPFKIKTQGDLGTVATGTQAGAPEVHNLKKRP